MGETTTRAILEVGAPAPDFTLRDQHGQDVVLSRLRGRPVLIVFYPFAFTGVCTGELRALGEHAATLDGEGCQLLVISCDTMFALRVFAEQEQLPFRLLSDFWPHGAVAGAYGVFDQKIGAAGRGSFLLDAEGVLRWSTHTELGQARDVEAYEAALATL